MTAPNVLAHFRVLEFEIVFHLIYINHHCSVHHAEVITQSLEYLPGIRRAKPIRPWAQPGKGQWVCNPHASPRGRPLVPRASSGPSGE